VRRPLGLFDAEPGPAAAPAGPALRRTA
jgi:hypothetical protein